MAQESGVRTENKAVISLKNTDTRLQKIGNHLCTIRTAGRELTEADMPMR
jgi:hypothetical protein